MALVLFLILLLPWKWTVAGHETSTALMSLERTATGVRGHVEIPIRDMDAALGLDVNDDGKLTWGN